MGEVEESDGESGGKVETGEGERRKNDEKEEGCVVVKTAPTEIKTLSRLGECLDWDKTMTEEKYKIENHNKLNKKTFFKIVFTTK